MSTAVIPFLPDSAPFSPSQRAWLNGFLAGLLAKREPASATVAKESALREAAEQFPWHDPALKMDERLKLAEGKPPEQVLMAAMAQLDCGACGYLCQTYAEAIAHGTEKDLGKCSPGGKETASKLRELVKLNVKRLPASTTPAAAPAPTTAAPHTRERPFGAPLLASRRLNGPDSGKDVRHVELGLKGSEIKYKVGDALGVWPENCLDLVVGILDRLGCSGAEEAKSIDGQPTSLFDSLRRERVITQPTEALIELLVDYASERDEARRLQAMLTEQGGEPLEGLHVLDVLQLVPSSRPPAAYFVDALGTLQPRLYSISSSPKAHIDQVHLTVAAVRYLNRTGRRVTGVASTYLADRVRPGEKVRVFVHESKNFSLPEKHDVPIIMIGPGTGIAPFRAFLHERRALGARGRSWLFFGDQRASCDYLYRDELDEFKRDGHLSKLDTAFSRDQDRKVYVQHRMAENAPELWKWIEGEGAHVYVCGDAKRMAADVDRALQDIVSSEGKLSPERAKEYVGELARKGRYQRDVY
ncbi:MAG TPA: sulfite reductase subunit alpha [Tepidisphaeraceae bacterium]